FICVLVAGELILFLDEIWESIYYKTGLFPSLETVHLEITTCPEIMCKKAQTSNIHKDFYQRVLYQDLVQYIPADIFVFTGNQKLSDSPHSLSFRPCFDQTY
ncbi:hypothetical protein CROQUDRAFT_44857, partial [Cronartium quercuum f. sp. fusiforme G11]